MSDVEIPMKSLVSGFVGITTGGLFLIMGWLDSWIFFSVLVVASLILVNHNYTLFPVGVIGMMGVGVFTKMNWLDPIVFFSALIISSLILAQQIVSRQIDTGNAGGN